MKHYTYRITNTKLNKHYYGTRSSKDPSSDLGIKYFSSSADKEFIQDQKENPHNYKYKIIKIFKNRKDALKLEIKLHDKFNVGINESFYNRAKQTSTGFDTAGIKWKMSVKGKNNIKNSIKSRGGHGGENNPRYGAILDENLKAKISYSLKNNEYVDSQETKNKKSHSAKIRANKNKKTISIFNNNDEEIYQCLGVDGLLNVCLEYNLPGSTFATSYREKGMPIYNSSNKNVLSRLKNNGFEKYIGWYAKEI